MGVFSLTTLEGGQRDLHSTCKAIMETEINLTIMEVISTISLVEHKLTAMDSLNTTLLADVHPIPLIVFRIITLAMDISQITWVVPRVIILADKIWSIILNLFTCKLLMPYCKSDMLSCIYYFIP